jgi:hypothetical protein
MLDTLMYRTRIVPRFLMTFSSFEATVSSSVRRSLPKARGTTVVFRSGKNEGEETMRRKNAMVRRSL